ncbi:MAG: hypothetical protein J0L86_09915 [Flavobacteriales bacterium]|nr:hypothetical protein [Flavobacteriales bacterium]
MEKFQLSLLFKIIGIGSASGLVFNHGNLYLISDNSTYLYEYQMDSTQLNKIELTENATDNIAKKLKPDFEAIAHNDSYYFLFGSGSTENRNKMIQMDAKTKEVIKTFDLSFLYESMRSFAEMEGDDFNLEGAIYDDGTWYFFNRGNGKNKRNVVFTVTGENLEDDYRILINEYKLPKIKGVRASFTDAIIVDDSIYFLATAENTESTYNDDEVVGSLIGRIDSNTMKIEFTKKITDTNKFEGLTFFKKTRSTIEFLLCEDNDTEQLESSIYNLTLDLKMRK